MKYLTVNLMTDNNTGKPFFAGKASTPVYMDISQGERQSPVINIGAAKDLPQAENVFMRMSMNPFVLRCELKKLEQSVTFLNRINAVSDAVSAGDLDLLADAEEELMLYLASLETV